MTARQVGDKRVPAPARSGSGGDEPPREARLRRFRHVTPAIWVLAATLLLAAVWRTSSRTWSQLPAGPHARIEDRRANRFRDTSYTQMQGILKVWLQQAYVAGPPRRRGLALARVAAMQRERGLAPEANAAAQEALRVSGNDPEVRAALSRPLIAADLAPVP